MNELEKEKFIRMQEDITHLKDDVQEIKGDVKELIANLDQRFLDMTNHNSSEVVKVAMGFQKQLEKKADVDNSWGETVWIWVFRTIGAAVFIAAGYAIIHAYTSIK